MSEYNPKKFEKKLIDFWKEKKIFEPSLSRPKRPFYNLMMFPYPSAEGLHVGNMYAFVGSDIHGRKKRMEGFDVFEPIGLDGFGIHTENYALQVKAHPKKLIKKSQKRFYKQLEMTGNAFAWQEKLATYDSEYYRWTQWIFVQMFKRGLAYRKKANVNWCPKCKTVLADEQVVGGECERCASQVIHKELEQWFFRITDYAEKLLRDLENLDWSERIKIAQRNWIGRSEGALIKFNVKCKMSNVKFTQIEVFTTRPDTIFGATYLVLSPEHELLMNNELGIRNYGEVKKYIERARKKIKEERIVKGLEKIGIELKGIQAVNPATKEEIPIWAADYVLGDVGKGAIMAVPAHDQRDFEFAKKYSLPIKMVVCPHYPAKTCPILDRAYEDKGHLVDSGKFTGMDSEKAKWEIAKFVGGERKVQYRLRDWLISRQRYWGPPIPMIFCDSCEKENKGEREDMPGWYSVSEKDLPVLLPYIKDFKPLGKGESPLATHKEFYETKCPKCGNKAKRETDVSDTFLDSSWYYYRYIDAKNKKEIFDKQQAKKWLPVDMYIGGAEHSVLHLLYTRFITKVFYDWGLVIFQEPFKKFRAHGLLIKDGAKMSKSRGNVVVPDKYIKEFGVDVLRMYLMFLGPFEQGGDFRDEGILGIERFLKRVCKLKSKVKSQKPKVQVKSQNLEILFHQAIKKIGDDIENLRYNTAISQLMILLNGLEAELQISKIYYETFLKLLAPFAPLAAEELWRGFGNKKIIHFEKWPEYEESKLKKKTYLLIVSVNGKARDKFEADIGTEQKQAEGLAMTRPKIKQFLADKTPKKVIFVKDRLINFVL